MWYLCLLQQIKIWFSVVASSLGACGCTAERAGSTRFFRWIIGSFPCKSLAISLYRAFQVLAGPAFIITFTISGVLMGFLADRLSHISIHNCYFIHFFPGCQGHGCWARKSLSCSYFPRTQQLSFPLSFIVWKSKVRSVFPSLLSSHIFTTIHFTTYHFTATAM